MKAGWELKALGDVVKLEYGKPLSKEDRTPDGDFAVYGANGIKDYSNKAYSKGPSIVVGRKGSAGELTYVTDDFWPLDVTYFTQHDPGLIDLKFLLLSLETAQLPSMAKGVKPGINRNDVYALPIPLPPLEEQKRIVSILDEAFEGLDRARENAEANLKSARELFESFVSEQLISVNAEEYSLSEMLEKGWITSHLDGNHGENYPKKSEFISSGVPYISANCIVDGEIDVALSKFLPEERADTLKKGTSYDQDVIFAHNATVGPVSVLKTDQPRILLGTSLTHYRCNQDRINPYFLCYEMRSAEFVAQYKGVMGQATRNQVPITIQRSFKHRIPNLRDQMRISKAARTTEINVKRSLALYRTKLQDISDLRQSLLQKAFAGELT